MNKWEIGMYCMFKPPKGHPIRKIKLGKIKGIGYINMNNHSQNIVTIEDSYGTWDIKMNKLDKYDFHELAGANWEDKNSQKDVEYFKKGPEYFQKLLSSKINCKTQMHIPETIEAIKGLWGNKPTRDLITYERILVMYLVNLRKIFEKVMYKYPKTLKIPEDDFCHADSKQGCFYATVDTFDDIIYQHKLSWQSVRNRQKGCKDNLNHPRHILSTDRIEELRIAIVSYAEHISGWICTGFSGDENPMDEKDYIDMLTEVDRIVKYTIELK